MLKRYRRRFIATAMLALTVVLLMLFVMFNVLYGLYALRRMDAMIDVIAGADGTLRYSAEALSGGVRMSAETPYETRFWTAFVGENGDIESIMRDSIADMDEQRAGSMVKEALALGRGRGFMERYRYRVLEREDGGRLAVFLWVSNEMNVQEALSRIWIKLFGGIWVLVFAVVALFSSRAVRPVADSLAQQKRFISDAEHELKTPLTILGAAADLLEEDVGADNEWLTSIRGQVERLTQLTGQLLRLSRLDEEASGLQLEKTNWSLLAQEAADTYAQVACARGKSFSSRVEENVWVAGDGRLLAQMLNLLLDNAVQYAAGKGAIVLTLERRRRQVVLSVTNLCDLDAREDLNKLFERFYRAESSRSRKTGGSGLGLSVAASIAQKHHGEIRATRPDADRICFTVALPLLRER